MATNKNAIETQTENAPVDDSRRERSTISFPYLDLNDAIVVAKGVHAVGGKNCQQEQLAAQLGIEMNSSKFRVKLNTSRIFGLITYTTDIVFLTEVGLRACDDKTETAARVDAFLTVPLYKRVYQEYKGASLPPLTALENAFIGFGVAQKQAANARQTFFRSAKQAGFLDADPKRLVLPSVKDRAGSHETNETISTSSGDSGREESKKKVIRGEDGDGGGTVQDTLLLGLIEKLPPPKSDWPNDLRRKWLLMASTIFDSVYTGGDADMITVTVQKDSAK